MSRKDLCLALLQASTTRLRLYAHPCVATVPTPTFYLEPPPGLVVQQLPDAGASQREDTTPQQSAP
jgi:hypothetical protein